VKPKHTDSLVLAVGGMFHNSLLFAIGKWNYSYSSMWCGRIIHFNWIHCHSLEFAFPVDQKYILYYCQCVIQRTEVYHQPTWQGTHTKFRWIYISQKMFT